MSASVENPKNFVAAGYGSKSALFALVTLPIAVSVGGDCADEAEAEAEAEEADADAGAAATA